MPAFPAQLHAAAAARFQVACREARTQRDHAVDLILAVAQHFRCGHRCAEDPEHRTGVEAARHQRGYEVRRHALHHFVADREKTERRSVLGAAKRNRLQKHLKEMIATKPPVASNAGGDIPCERCLRRFARKLGHRRVKRGDDAVVAGHHEHLAAGELPEGRRRVLNGGRIARGHQRLEWGQRGEQCRRAFEGDLALLLQSIEGDARGVQCLGQLFTHAQLDAVANNQKNGGGDQR